MAAILGNPPVIWGSRSLLCTATGSSLNHLFRRYAHTQAAGTGSKVKISPDVKKWLLEKRAKQEQAKLKELRQDAILDGLPKRGDRFFKASWKILVIEAKSHP